MSLYVIADLHLPLGVNKPMDIFGGWDNYVERLEYNWQRKIKPEDTVVIPGDLCWALKIEESLPDFRFLERLNGRKLLIKGNHDLWWGTAKKVNDFFEQNDIKSVAIIFNSCEEYEGLGICGTRGWVSESGEQADETVLAREAGRLEASLCAAEAKGLKPVVFLHYPPIFISSMNEPIIDVLKRHGITECFYGHIHGKMKHSYAFKGEKDGINYHLVSSDYLQFDPLDISYLVQSTKE